MPSPSRSRGLDPPNIERESSNRMRVLFLDDDDRRHKEFKRSAVGAVIDRAFSAREAILLLRENSYDRVYLDYDMDDDPAVRRMDDYESGQVVAEWLAENAAGREGCLFIIHSRCKSGATAMQGTLQSAGLRAVLGEWTWRVDEPKTR